MKKIVITGGSGFIGSHLIRRKAAEGGVSIVSVDIKEPRERLPGVEYIDHDVRDMASLTVAGDIDMVYNLAAVHTTPGHPFSEYYDTNVRGALQIADFMKRHAIQNLVFTSSISVYGPSERMKDEFDAPAPNSAYGWSKLIAEEVFSAWHAGATGSRLLIVRPAVVFGKGEGGNFTRLAKLMERGIFIYPGRRDTIKSCVYVKDLLDYIDAMWRQGERTTVFNGCYAERYELQQVVGKLRRFFPRAREYTLPKSFLFAGAQVAGALPNSLGIHPERILKLVNSTNIYPKVLVENGISKVDPLDVALDDWYDDADKKFV